VTIIKIINQSMTMRLNNKGFGLVETLLVIVVIAVIGVGGWAVYHNGHKAKTASATSSTTVSKGGNTKANSKTTNPYTDWKTYCDSVYGYCFKYPTTWTVTSNNAATSVGSEGGISLMSPSKTVQVSYSNASVKDSNAVSFMTTAITKLDTTSQDLTLVGGYIPTSGNNGLAGNDIPSYQVVDASILGQFPLTVDKTSQFPSNPTFTDQNTADKGYDGALVSKPVSTINSVQQAETWLSSIDSKTSMQILESLYYSK
jgi:Tfp pilus assembly major pilin PilA